MRACCAGPDSLHAYRSHIHSVAEPPLHSWVSFPVFAFLCNSLQPLTPRITVKRAEPPPPPEPTLPLAAGQESEHAEGVSVSGATQRYLLTQRLNREKVCLCVRSPVFP